MRIVWDEPKRQTNLQKRNLDFADLDIEFFNEARLFDAKLGRATSPSTGWISPTLHWSSSFPLN